MFALIENGAVKQYPYSLFEIRQANPNTSFPPQVSDATMAEYGAQRVYFATQPVFDEKTQALVEGAPVFSTQDNRWTQTWTVRQKTAEELEAQVQALQNSIVDATQLRLDTFAQTRNYSGILSASTYATSNVARFQAEGEYCVNQRDATWAKLYQILAEVQAGTRPMPTGYADIEAELPVLVWP